MLAPDNRHLLVDALRPPAGMHLDAAVGTTFTLDLQALLLAPVSFALYGLDAGTGTGDPLAVLEAVRRHAQQITVFAQAGAIALPRRFQPVLAWLEDSVVPVRPPRGHLFHPKAWALRFRGDDGATAHRLLVMSRNLTFDTSWDTIVRLDGTDTGAPVQTSAPLVAFFDSLVGRAVLEVSDDRRAAVHQLAQDLGRVQWELPEGVRELRFWPLGVDGLPSPDVSGDCTLVISPFLSADWVQTLSQKGSGHLLVSRPESLDGVGRAAVGKYVETLVLDADHLELDDPVEPDAADGDPPDAATDAAPVGAPPAEDEPDAEEARPGRQAEAVGAELRGLHAKVFLTERGSWTHLFTGSANATGPAFGGNVELLVEAVSRRKDLSIDGVIGHPSEGGGKRQPTLRDLVRPYQPRSDDAIDGTDADRLTYRLEALVRRIAEVPFEIHVGELTADGLYPLSVRAGGLPPVPDQMVVWVRLASVSTATPVRLDTGELAGAEQTVSLEAITSFLVVQATALLDGQELVAQALVNARLVGAPADRRERLLTHHLRSPDDLIRYLLFLLFELHDEAQLDAAVAALTGGSAWRTSPERVPLLETMLTALCRGGTSLDRVAELLDDLRSTPDGAQLIPAGLDEIWEPIRQVREELRT